MKGNHSLLLNTTEEFTILQFCFVLYFKKGNIFYSINQVSYNSSRNLWDPLEHLVLFFSFYPSLKFFEQKCDSIARVKKTFFSLKEQIEEK